MLTLKVFSGTQFGAEVEVSPNQLLSIGNDYNCDIYIKSFADNFQGCNFIINEHGLIKFSNLDGKFSFYDDKVLEEDCLYDLPCYLNFDGIYLAIGEKESIRNWPSVESKITTDDLVDLLVDANEGGKESKKQIQDFKLFMDKIIFGYKKYVFSNLAWVYSLLKKRLIYLHKIYPRYLYFGILIIGLIICSSYLGVGSLINSRNIAQEMQVKDQEIIGFRKAYDQLPSKYASLNIQSLSSGYLLCGIVESSGEISQIKQYFAKYPKLVSYNLFVYQDAINKISGILSDAHISNLKMKYDTETQNLNVYGIAMLGLGAVNDAQIKLDNHLPCVSNINFGHVYDIKQIRQDIKDITQNISSYLEVKENLAKGEILISGFLTGAQSASLISRFDKLRDKYKDVLLIKLDIKDALKALPVTIDAVYTGEGTPYVVTGAGQYIYLGGDMGEFKLSAITPSKIVLTGKFNLEIPLDAILGNNLVVNSNNILAKDQVINNEFNKLTQSIESEQQQIVEISKYQAKIKDPELNGFLSKQLDVLKEDILVKKHELEMYNNRK